MWANFSFAVDPSSKGPVLCRDPRLRFVPHSRGDADDLGGRTAAPLVSCKRRGLERRLEHTMFRPTQMRLYLALPDSWCLSLRVRLHRCRATTVRFEPRLVGNEREENIPVSAAVVTRTRSTCCLRRRCRAVEGHRSSDERTRFWKGSRQAKGSVCCCARCASADARALGSGS